MLRIKEIRKANNVTARELAKHLNVAESTMSLYENGKREPDFKTLKKISEYLNVSIDYLLGNSASISDLPANVRPIKTKRFPMLGEIACGEPIYANEEHESYIDASADIRADFCLTAKGDSMIGARIQDGDVVFIREQQIVENGEIAAVIIDEEATLKRWYYYPAQSKLVLIPENPAYEPLVYVGEELNSIRCLGKAVCFMSKI